MDNEELMRNIIDRLARIEENTKGVSDLLVRISDVEAETEKNRENISKMQENQTWAWRTIAGIGVSLAFYLITKIIEIK